VSYKLKVTCDFVETILTAR